MPRTAKTQPTTDTTDAPEVETPVTDDTAKAEEIRADVENLDTDLAGKGEIHLPSGRVISYEERRKLFRSLAAPFAPDQVEKLPKYVGRKPARGEFVEKFKCIQGHRDATKASADGVYCGGYHGYSIHIDYIGHAGATMRLNSVCGTEDWNWEFMHLDVPAWAQGMAAELVRAGEFDRAERLIKEHGQPIFRDGGLWIRVTVLGVTRIGFGDAQDKTGPNAIKEIIGDGIRNAGLRFGIATYLWNKSEAAENIKTQAAQHAYDAMIKAQTEAWERTQSAREQAAAAHRETEEPEVARGQQDNAAEASQTRPHPNAQEAPAETRGATKLDADSVEGDVLPNEGEIEASFNRLYNGGDLEGLRSLLTIAKRAGAGEWLLDTIREGIAIGEKSVGQG